MGIYNYNERGKRWKEADKITKEKEEIAMILTGTMEENCVLQKHAKYKSQLNNKQYKT